MNEVQKFYYDSHKDQPDKELAAALGITVAKLKKYRIDYDPPAPEKSEVEILREQVAALQKKVENPHEPEQHAVAVEIHSKLAKRDGSVCMTGGAATDIDLSRDINAPKRNQKYTSSIYKIKP